MTEQNYLALVPRESTHTADSVLFAFYRLRSGTWVRFLPASPMLHFASKDTDTFRCTVPPGFFQTGDQVKVLYKNVVVFVGSLAGRVNSASRGSDALDTATFAGPWSAMARMVYRQNWKVYNGSTVALERSSRLILNQHEDGTAQTLNSELTEIVNHAATPCGYQKGTISVSTQVLPADPCRDITIADAIRRELRFFPKAVCRFNYATTNQAGTALLPTLNITRAGSAFTVPSTVLQRSKTYNSNPIDGVDLEIEQIGEVNGVSYRQLSHQRAGNTLAGNPNCLYATLRLKGASASTVCQSFKSVTEDLPSSLSDKAWWIARHPRLANVAASQLTITSASRTITDNTCVRISKSTAGELQRAGLKCEVSKFTAVCTITTADDKEENITLTMNYLMTNATTKTYTWTASSSTAAGETVPSGLATALLAERSGELSGEHLTIRLGASLPVLGQTLDNLLLQSFDVDCQALTASLNFGVPDYLSPEDLASLLSGFRNKRTPSCSLSRLSGKVDEDKDDVELGPIPPLSSTEFAPGTKAKTVIGASNTGKIKLDPSSLSSSVTIQPKKLKLNGTDTGAKLLASADIDIVQKQLVAGNNITLTPSDDGKQITIAATGPSNTAFSGTIRHVESVYYDTVDHKFYYGWGELTFQNGVLIDYDSPLDGGYLLDFHQAVPEGGAA